MSSLNSAPAVRQVWLPGQAAAPEGPVDLKGMYAMHFAFRRDLDRFAGAIHETPIEDRATWRALRRRWDLFCHVLHDHHEAEDRGLWPELRHRAHLAGDQAADEVLDAMAAEHAEIDPLLKSIVRGLDQLAAAADRDARGALEVRIVAARERLRHHLSHEERDGLALVQAYLTPADWERFEKVHVTPAKTLRETLVVVGWVLHDMPSSGVARLMGQAGPFLFVYRLFLRRPFERRERRAFRYVDDARANRR